MGVALTKAVALQGLRGALVDVEASIASGLPQFKIIGLPDAALAEASHRVLAAASNSGLSLAQHRVTINLSPAVLPKHGSGFDLAIALAALAAGGVISDRALAGTVHLGELGLDGRVRPVPGILPAVSAARAVGVTRVVVPTGNLAEARLVPGIDVVAVASLREAAIRHGGDFPPISVEPVMPPRRARAAEAEPPELHDVIGNEDAVHALIVAAAGAHNLFFDGPPGAGKTMLAERLPGILPDLDEPAAVEATSIRSLEGVAAVEELVERPPFEAPHHTASAAALVGGGSGRIRPGAAVRATHGVLFLDEAPEFQSSALDALRQPLESGTVTISRANEVARYPARFQLVLAANPCPCGHYGEKGSECSCPPTRRRQYLGRLSGPLLDRVDIRVSVPRMTPAQLRRTDDGRAPWTADARERVRQARVRSAARLAGTPWRANAHVSGEWLLAPVNRPTDLALAPLLGAVETGVLSTRGLIRCLRLAWTLADLAGRPMPEPMDTAQALTLRSGAAA